MSSTCRSLPLLTLAILAAWQLPTTTVHACAPCVVGDPTLTTMGPQRPFAGRLRASSELMYRTEAIGVAGRNRVEVAEGRFINTLAYAPTRSLMLTAQVPIVSRSARLVNLAQRQVTHVGDVELRARWVLFADRALSPKHLLSVLAGSRLPTAPMHEQPQGVVDPQLQTGTGSLMPLLGFSYATFRGAWSAYVSEVAYGALPGRGGFRTGHVWLGTHTVQYQANPTWAVRLGANFRLDTPLRVDDGPEPDGGGLATFVAPAILVSPLMDLVVYAEVNIPALRFVRGTHEEGPVMTLGGAYDF